MKDTTAIILAGGKSSRLGEDKGLALLNNIPMIQYIIRVFEDMNLPILIIANNNQYQQFGYPVFKDIVSEKGPAGGILTALTHSTTNLNIIVSCDTPFVSKELFNYLLQNHKTPISYASFQNKKHPLIGIYEKIVLSTFEKNIHENRLKIGFILKELNATEIIVSEEVAKNNGRCFTNINTKEELNKAKI